MRELQPINVNQSPWQWQISSTFTQLSDIENLLLVSAGRISSNTQTRDLLGIKVNQSAAIKKIDVTIMLVPIIDRYLGDLAQNQKY